MQMGFRPGLRRTISPGCSLLREVHSFRDVIHTLFAPAAQGTIRPWSERGFFLLFESIFGLDSLPFRICVFVTMAANLTLVAWITRRITGSPAAGAFAAMLWTANAALVTVMSWNSSYNEALCSFVSARALALFIRYVETGRPAWWWWQLVVFTLGFGALEINVVYPALAAAYVLFVAGRKIATPAADRAHAAFLHLGRLFPHASRGGCASRQRPLRGPCRRQNVSDAGRVLEVVACSPGMDGRGHSGRSERDLLDHDRRAGRFLR